MAGGARRTGATPRRRRTRCRRRTKQWLFQQQARGRRAGPRGCRGCQAVCAGQSRLQDLVREEIRAGARGLALCGRHPHNQRPRGARPPGCVHRRAQMAVEMFSGYRGSCKRHSRAADRIGRAVMGAFSMMDPICDGSDNTRDERLCGLRRLRRL